VGFAIGCEISILHIILEPRLLGSHAWIYTDAARALLAGGDPWRAGPPAGVFAGPPPMLLPFIPFVALPNEVIAAIWLIGSLVGLVWLLRRLGLPGYWIAFTPFFAVVALGHLELLAVIVLLYGGRFAGLAAIVKPYMGFALLAQKNWTALAIGALAVVVTAPFLMWPLFIEQREFITANLARQYAGDSVFGNPILMAIAVVALASLGWKRALWLGAPLVWPFAQQGYKLMAVPLLTPVMALCWALPFPGSTLTGVVLQAILERVDAWRPLPPWLRTGIEPLTDLGAAYWPKRREPTSRAAEAVAVAA
jgi:hypothetical protein